jgi:acyl-CoA thioesterase-2
MSSAVEDLLAILDLETIEVNLFRGRSPQVGWQRVFGGQVVGQALVAACRTVQGRQPHSMHAYFLLAGDPKVPIVYDVDRIRDGGSFTTRRVVAIQGGQAIFNLATSFQKPESGLEHQDPMPAAPSPDSLPSLQERYAAYTEKRGPSRSGRAFTESPFDVRTTDPIEDPFNPSVRPAERLVWLRTVGRLPDDPALHHYLLAYASDYAFITTALLPHGVSVFSREMQVASLDHVMWFHQPCRVDEWLLYAIDSPAAHGARGLVRGRVFTHDGRLVASTAQEGLMRRRAP